MKKNIVYNIAFVIILVISALMYGTLMFNNNVWYDEAYSLAMIKHSFSEIARITAEDVHPPLYYFGLKLFTSIGGDVITLSKIFSIIPILLTMLVGYFQLGKIVDKKTGFVFVAIMALLPLYQPFAVEIRMYTWASFSVFSCGIFAYRAISEEKKRYFAIYALFGVISAYLHYFAFVSVLIIYFIAFVAATKKKLFVPWLITALLSLAAYLPWLSSFVMQLGEKVTNDYWIAPITLDTIKHYADVWLQCGEYTKFYIIAFLVVFIISILGVLVDCNKVRICALLFGVSVFVFTCVIGIGASVLVRPVFIERYAIPAIPLVLAGIAAGISVIKSKWFLILLAIVGIAGYGASYPYIYNLEYESSEKNIEYILENGEYDSLICFVDSHLYGVLSYYEPQKPIYRPALSKGSPFENIYALSQRDIENEERTLVFVPKGETAPVEVCEGYFTEYYCEVVTYGMASDVYLCTKTSL